jgi:hypothetical protein
MGKTEGGKENGLRIIWNCVRQQANAVGDDGPLAAGSEHARNRIRVTT